MVRVGYDRYMCHGSRFTDQLEAARTLQGGSQHIESSADGFCTGWAHRHIAYCIANSWSMVRSPFRTNMVHVWLTSAAS